MPAFITPAVSIAPRRSSAPPCRLRLRRGPAPGARLACAALASGLLAILLLATAPPTLAQAQNQGERGRVMGRITGAPEDVALEGTRVLLLQFRLNDEGTPEGSPIQTQTAAVDGSYAFSGVPIEERTVYQLGATVEGRVVGSQPFTFPNGQREVQLNLAWPRGTSAGEGGGLRIAEGLIAVEPRRGAVWVTEVVHLMNPHEEPVAREGRPLELSVPPAAEDLELLRGGGEAGHERLGDKLLVYGDLGPGRTTVAFRYRLPVWLGTATLEKRYPHPVGVLSVLSPQGDLELRGVGFTAQDTQEIQGTRYDTWAARGVEPGEALTVSLRGVPLRQEVFLVPLVGFFGLMAVVVVWFLRVRLTGRDDGD